MEAKIAQELIEMDGHTMQYMDFKTFVEKITGVPFNEVYRDFKEEDEKSNVERSL